MRKVTLVVFALMMIGLAACSTATPTPEYIVVTATAGVPTQAPPPVEPSPTEAPMPDDGNPPVFLVIISPRTDDEFKSTGFVEVRGSARGMPNDDVIVFFVDKGRNIHGYACATLGEPNENNIKTYKTEMTAPVNESIDGKVIAVVLNDDGSVAGSAGVFATAKPNKDGRYVTIDTPGNSCVITNPASFTVEGSAQGGFDNNVVVQLQDANGRVLAEEATVYGSASAGGSGSWSVTMSIDVPAGTEGRLVAFSPDPAGGSPVSSAKYTVYLGE
jgi:hypothetical protein